MIPRWLAISAVAVLVFTACANPGVGPAASTPGGAAAIVTPGATGPTPVPGTPAAAARRGGTFTDSTFGGDATTMQPIISNDSASNDRIVLMYESLLTRDPNTLDFKGALAESWRFDQDSLGVTYTLRPNLTWSDGTPLTSADFRFTWEKLFDPNVKFQVRSLIANIVGVPETPDPRTIKFRFKEISAASFLWTDVKPPVPMHIFQGQDINEGPRNNTNTVGSGPFVLREWVRDNYAIFVANERYWQGRPNLDQYVFRVVPNQVAQYQALKTGEIDTAQINAPDWDEATRLQNVKTLSYYYYASPWDYIGFNLKNPMLSDKRVRQAIAHAINKQPIIERVLLGKAKAQDSIFPVTSPVFTDNVPKFPFDQNRARQLLREAGWVPGPDGIVAKDGQALRLRFHYNEGNTRRQQTATIAQQQLREVGIQVDVIAEEFGAFLTRLRESRDFDMFMLGWIGGADPDGARGIWMTDGSQNYVGYSNPEVDRLFPQGDRVLEMAQRRPIYEQIQRLISEDQPYVFLWTIETLRGFNSRIVGPQPVPYGTVETKWNVNQWYSETGR